MRTPREQIGVAASTVPNVEGIMGSNSQTLLAGSELFANQTIRTGNRGVADLVFVDKTNLSVGPTSEVKLDKFVYDPSGSKGRVVMEATRGAFRFVTGSQDHSAYAIKTPYGTLGVRGTTVEVVLASKADRKLCLNGVRPSERLPRRVRCENQVGRGGRRHIHDLYREKGQSIRGRCHCVHNAERKRTVYDRRIAALF